MESEQRAKQQFLVKEILQAGYDGVKFADFLQNERENGEDVNQWAFQSLTEAVKKFQHEHPRPFERDEPEDNEELHHQSPRMGEQDEIERNLEVEISRVYDPVQTVSHKPGRDPELQKRLNNILEESKREKSSLVVKSRKLES
jgi:hypothetical protein